MKKIILKFRSTAEITLEHSLGDKHSEVVSSAVNLEISDNLKRELYMEKEGIPNSTQGHKATTAALTAGIIANMHTAHNNGHWDSAEHLRFVISQLEAGFSQANAQPFESTFSDNLQQ
jgi:hypothetical protein